MNRFLLKQQKVRSLAVCLFCALGLACSAPAPKQTALGQLESQYIATFDAALAQLDSLLLNPQQQKKHYLRAKACFKQLEPVFAFVDQENYKALNQPNLLHVDEEDATNIKISQAFGFQVLEEQLFDENPDNKAIATNVGIIKSRLRLVQSNTKLKLKDYHLLWLLRDELIRIATLGITGYDSPVLNNSLVEAATAYKQLQTILSFYQHQFRNKALYTAWQNELEASVQQLDTTFDRFDRYYFIKNHTHKQLQLIQDTQQDWGSSYPFELAIKNKAVSLFSDQTFNLNFFSDNLAGKPETAAQVALGKRIFNDVRLSKNKDMSCATCHQAGRAFTDGLKTFARQQRNTPTLTYAALQKSFFYDGRAGSLEGQIVGVVNNQNEFHANLKEITQVVEQDSLYQQAFAKNFGGKITDYTIRKAIASYVRSLSLFNSKFDDNINNKAHNLSKREINGFNLFMGKATCATCHFPPVFNGTIPPHFTDSELEALGVPQDTLPHTSLDTDLGRYNMFKTKERKHFFKTPTLRNIELTAPYMHNGVYSTLGQVMDFYNVGGGNGMGFQLKQQTLPADSLHLSPHDIEDIILFMKSLTDN